MFSAETCKIILLIFGALAIIFQYYWSSVGVSRTHRYTGRWTESIKPVAEIKNGIRWIVVTSNNYPTESLKRFGSLENWNLVVVADTKTPEDWYLENVHFLSVVYQKSLPFSLAASLSHESFTRKNIGYLYAISQGAEWIYDTDDSDNISDEFFLDDIEILQLEQFDFEDTVSGVRYQAKQGNDTKMHDRLFNPYEFYGVDRMRPRVFPVDYIEKHKIGKDNQVLCYKMKRSAVQQGIGKYYPDSDVDHGLLNKFAPPITLSVGAYAPLNSQNTLFHKSAFHTLFLRTTVAYGTTDIWRSLISQKILHLSGLTVSFVPINAVQYGNAHDYLKDFKDEKQVYEDSGRMIEYLHNWECKNGSSLENCIHKLAEELVTMKFWREEDAKLMKMMLSDLKLMGFKFPNLLVEGYQDPYVASYDETERNVNCRRMNLEFELVNPKNQGEQNFRKAEQKLNYFRDLVDWCNETGYSVLSNPLPSVAQLAAEHESNYVLQNDLNTVLVVVNNYAWSYGHGLIQRLYQPYFASVIFCGSWYPETVKDHDNYTSIISPFNFVHMNPAEMQKGYLGYHCVTLVKEMRLNNVLGYFMMADDAVFNIWQRIDYSRVHHLTGITAECEESSKTWDLPQGLQAARNILKNIKNNQDPKTQQAWEQFQNGLKSNGYTGSIKKLMASNKGRSYSDFFYIPTSQSEYYARLMRVFYENEFFLEIAVNKFLKSVNHQTSLFLLSSYLWRADRDKWDTFYNKNMVAMHPVKLSQFENPGKNRTRYCRSILQTWVNIMFGGSQDFISKPDNE